MLAALAEKLKWDSETIKRKDKTIKFGNNNTMLAPTPMDNAMVIDSGKPASAGGGEANGREELVRSLVRRYLLLSQVPASDWSRHEAALVLLSNSMLDRYVYPNSGPSVYRACCYSMLWGTVFWFMVLHGTLPHVITFDADLKGWN